MNNIKELLNIREEETTAPHELADSVNYIKDNIGFSGKYRAGYWLGAIKKSGLTHFQVKQLVDKALTLPPKYNRGGFLSNQMK